MKTDADFEQAADSASNPGMTRSKLGDPRQDLQQGCLARPVRSDNSQTFPTLDFERNIPECGDEPGSRMVRTDSRCIETVKLAQVVYRPRNPCPRGTGKGVRKIFPETDLIDLGNPFDRYGGITPRGNVTIRQHPQTPFLYGGNRDAPVTKMIALRLTPRRSTTTVWGPCPEERIESPQ